MRFKVISAAFGAAIAFSSISAAFAAPAPKVYICHNTGSESNPVVLIHVSRHAADAHIENHEDAPGTADGCTTAP